MTNSGLEGDDYFKYRILTDMSGAFSTNAIRLKYRNSKKTKDGCCVSHLALN